MSKLHLYQFHRPICLRLFPLLSESEHKGKDRWPRERDGVAEGIVALIGWIAVGIRGLGDQTEETRDPYREGREDHLPW